MYFCAEAQNAPSVSFNLATFFNLSEQLHKCLLLDPTA